MAQVAGMTVGLRVSDVSGAKRVRASEVPGSSTIGELVSGLLTRMGLARHDADGRPLTYSARLEREGRHLSGTELVGNALHEEDELVLTPNIDAGASRAA